MTSIGSGVRDIRIQESWSGSSHLCRRTRRSGLGAPRISEEDSADAAARCWISSAALSLAAERQDIRMKMQKFEDVPDALCDGDRATQMKRRAQPQAAKLPGVRQPRINDLLRGRLHRFSVDAPASVLCGRVRQTPRMISASELGCLHRQDAQYRHHDRARQVRANVDERPAVLRPLEK